MLHDVLGIETSGIPGCEDLDRAFTGAILEEAGKLAVEVLAPLNAVGDAEGCRLENGVVRTPEGFGRAFAAIRDGGWNGLDLPEEFAMFRREMEDILGAVETGDLEAVGHIRRAHISMSFARMMRYARPSPESASA